MTVHEEVGAVKIPEQSPLEHLEEIRAMRRELNEMEMNVIKSLHPKQDRVNEFIISRIQQEGRDGIQPHILLRAVRYFGEGRSSKDAQALIDLMRERGIIELVQVLPLPGCAGRPVKKYRTL